MIIALVLNLIIVVLEIIAMTNQYKRDGNKIFIYYTNISNILAGLVGIAFVVAGLISLSKGTQIPVIIKGARLIVSTMLGVTFIVVLTILAPSLGKGGYKKMLISHNAKYVHLICPLLSMISFLFFEPLPELDQNWVFIAVIPTIIYGIVGGVCNYKKIWDGPYDFLKVRNQPVWMSVLWVILIVGGACLISFLLWHFN